MSRGPAAGPQIEELVARFSHARRIAVGVSVVGATPDAWHAVIERDSAEAHRPDLSLAVSHEGLPPVVGLVQSHSQPEYPDARHDDVHSLIDGALSTRDVAVVRLGTGVDPRSVEAKHFRHVEAALERMDAVVTTRLHGLVLSLRRGTPAVAVDPILGGGKVTRQAASLGWPAVVTAGDLSEESEPHVAEALLNQLLEEAGVRVELGHCLTGVEMAGARITGLDAGGGRVGAATYVDASYEGDLLAAVGARYRVGGSPDGCTASGGRDASRRHALHVTTSTCCCRPSPLTTPSCR